MKKLVCVLTVMLFTMCLVPFLEAEAKELDTVNSGIIDRSCIECGAGPEKIDITVNNEKLKKTEVSVPNLKHEDIRGPSGSLIYTRSFCGTCGHSAHSTQTVGNLKPAYKCNASGELDISVDGESFHADCPTNKATLLSVIEEEYEPVETESGRIYVHKSYMENEKDLVYVDENNLATFAHTNIDLYKEECIGEVDGHRADKVQIKAIYEDGPNASGGLSRYVGTDGVSGFFVCENHRKCLDCNNNVASSGVTGYTVDDEFKQNSGKLYLSKYCAERHACAFVWEVENGGDKYKFPTEGLECREKRMDSDYCPDHRCSRDECGSPIIGVNKREGRETPAIYTEEKPEKYSRYCESHFCLHLECTSPRITTSQIPVIYVEREADPEAGIEAGIYVENYYQYCLDHCNVCGADGCENPVSKEAFDVDNKKLKMVCASCRDLPKTQELETNVDNITDAIVANNEKIDTGTLDKRTNALGSENPADLGNKIKDDFQIKEFCDCGAMLTEINGVKCCPLCDFEE